MKSRNYIYIKIRYEERTCSFETGTLNTTDQRMVIVGEGIVLRQIWVEKEAYEEQIQIERNL